MPNKLPLPYRWIPLAVALLVAIALIWGESLLWGTNPLFPPEQALDRK